MAVSDQYRDYVLEQLGRATSVRARRMFGGLGIYGEDRFFAIVHDDVLYLRVGDGNRADFERAGMSPFRPYTDRAVTMPYYELPAEVLEDEAALRLWVGRSLQAAMTGGGRTARTPAARRQRNPR